MRLRDLASPTESCAGHPMPKPPNTLKLSSFVFGSEGIEDLPQICISSMNDTAIVPTYLKLREARRTIDSS